MKRRISISSLNLAILVAGITLGVNGALFSTRAGGVTYLGGFDNLTVGIVLAILGCAVCALGGYLVKPE